MTASGKEKTENERLPGFGGEGERIRRIIVFTVFTVYTISNNKGGVENGYKSIEF